MIEASLVLLGLLLAITVTTAFEYYRQLNKVRQEYEKARELVEDIILSFNRQLNGEAEKLDGLAYKVEALSSRSGEAVERSEELGFQWRNLEPKVRSILEGGETVLDRINEVDKKVNDAVASQEALAVKISYVERQTRQLSPISEPRAEAVIPIRREKALAPLTETELSVLKILASEGSKTAPAVRARVGVSREHTARLMKKLYEDGYLERDTRKIPFKYLVKKEMIELLKKAQSQN